jgi:2-polyprenyl-3-methyl-5-hydroxy-6-metoxy-1,4-benzoquinol methylase
VSCGARYSLAFVREALPDRARRLLEVGCGDGALAAMLAADGFEVVAIDAAEDAVARARARGVDARLAEWPQFDAAGFDACRSTAKPPITAASWSASWSIRPGPRAEYGA